VRLSVASRAELSETLRAQLRRDPDPVVAQAAARSDQQAAQHFLHP